jgi:hypothetical protein
MATIDFVETDCSDLACHKGVTFLVDCLVYQDCNNKPDDLTGYTARLLVFDEVETNVIIDIPGTINTTAKGIIHFQVGADDTDDLPVGMFSNNVEITSSGGIVYRLSSGAFQITD